MSCTFNKYQNALGVYRVVIDSVLSNALENNSTFKPSTDLPRLLDYFKDFQYQAEDVESFTQLALDSVVNAYNLVLEELSNQGIVKTAKLTKKDSNLLTKNFKAQLEKFYAKAPSPVAVTILPQDSQEVKGSSMSETPNTITIGGIQPVASTNPSLDVFTEDGSIKLRQNVLVDRNSITKMSDVQFNFYQGAPIVRTNMLRDLTRNVFDIRILNPLKSHSVDAEKTLNEEIRKYKNKLFANMVIPLEPYIADIADESKVLYDELGNVMINNIENLFKVLGAHYNNYNGGVGVRAYDLASWSVNNKPLLDQYNAFVVLSNFDTLVEFSSGGTIRTKGNYRNLETASDKYVLASTNKMRTGYSSDAIVHADDETTKLFKMFIETIPVVKISNGHISSNMFLSTKQIYHTFNKLKNEIDNSDPVGSIEKAIVDALTKVNDRGGRNLTVTDLNALLSMYLRIFRNPTNDSIIERSSLKGASLLNTINNSGQFALSDSISGAFANLHTSGQDINFLDLIASNIAKIDSLSYNEVVYNSATGMHSIRELMGQASNRQKSVLRSGIGGSVMNFTKDTLEPFLTSHHLNISKGFVVFNLNGKSLAYNPVAGTFQIRDENDKVKTLERPSEIFKIPHMDMASADIFQIEETPTEFNNYRQVIESFEDMFNQPLSSDNYKLLDLFRGEIDGTDENTQGKHLDSMLALIGNYAFLAKINTEAIDRDSNVKNTSIKTAIDRTAAGLAYNRVWDKNQKRYKIDFNQAGSAALEDYSEVMNNYYGDSIKSVIKNTEGNFVPTVSLLSPINRFRDIIRDLETDENNLFTSPLADNYVFRNKDLIKRTLIRSGVKNRQGDVISPSRLNEKELLQTSILYEFLENKANTGKIAIQPTNYADKSKQNLLEVDGETYVSYWDSTKNRWAPNVKYKTLTPTQIADTYFKSMAEQYVKLTDKLSDDYGKLLELDEFGTPFIIGSFLNNQSKLLSSIPGFTLDTKYEDLPDELKGTDLEQEFEKIQNVKASIEEFDNASAIPASSGTISKLKAIDKIFKQFNGDTIRSAFADANVDYVNQLHYEKSPIDGKVGINASLIPEYESFVASKETLDKRKANIRATFLKSLVNENFKLNYYDSDGNVDINLDKALTTYNIGDAFKTKLKTHGQLELSDSDGNLNPILEDYLWNVLLIGRNFQMLTVGTGLGHPAKGVKTKDAKGNPIKPTHAAVMAARLTAQNKRMVIHPATMHPYTMNLINGIGFKSRRVFVNDPSSRVFNLVGDVDDIDAQDGSSMSTVSAINMMNVSLLDQKVGYTHKSLGGSMTKETGSANLTKHADFAMTNENLRNSTKLENIFRNLTSNRFDVMDDMSVNIDLTKDYNGQEIDINALIGELHFNTRHFKEAFADQEFINKTTGLPAVELFGFKDSIATYKGLKNVGNNLYEVTFSSNGTDYTTTLELNNYYSLWQVLGGKQSLEYSNDYLGNHPDSFLDGYKRSNKSHDGLTEFINRVGFWFDDGSGYTSDSEVNEATLKRELFAKYTNHSGGAVGADSAFDELGRGFGLQNNNHYYYGTKTPKGNVTISKSELNEGLSKLPAAAKRLGKNMATTPAVLNLLARNWVQVKNSTQIVAVAKLTDDYKSVQGGTGYAVAMAQNEIDNGGKVREINVFNLEDNSWYRWNGVLFAPSETPILQENFAGIGSRQDKGSMTQESMDAIQDVYQKTLDQLVAENGVSFESETIYRTEEGKTFRDITDLTSDPMQYGRIKEFFNKFVTVPNSHVDNFSPYIGSRPTQKNVIQPLKLNYQGHITNVSGQKVGAKNIITPEQLESGTINYSYEDNIHFGIQLTADHHSDESEVTEQTQIVSTLPFTGDTPEYAKKVFRSINHHINKNLGFLIDTINDPNFDNKPESKKKVEDLLKKILVKTFEDKDVDSLADSLVNVIKTELVTKIGSNLKLPISSPDLYNSVNTAVANFFTKEGIRRKMPGMAAVAKPYAEYTKFKKLPTGETVSLEVFNKWLEEHPDAEQYKQYNQNMLNVGETVIDHLGDSHHMKDPSTYFRTKLRYSRLSEQEKALWKVDSFADKELASTHHLIKIKGVGAFNYFDFDMVLLPHLLKDAQTAQDKLNGILKKKASDYVLSPLQMRNEGTLEQQEVNALEALNERISEYNSARERSKIGDGFKELKIESLDENGVTITYSKFNKVQGNILRNSITAMFKDLHKNKTLTASLYFNQGDAELGSEIEIETVYGEVAMSFPHFSTFGLKPDQDLNEVTEDFFLRELNKNSLPLTRKHDLYIKHSDGDHLHVLLSGSETHSELVANGTLYPVREETISDSDGKRYSVDRYGRKDKLLGYDQLYEAEVDGKLVRYVILNGDNLQEFERLKEMVNSKGSKYDTIVPNFTASVENLPVLQKLAEKNIFKANLNHLTKLTALLAADSKQQLTEFITELDLSNYSDHSGFKKMYDQIQNSLLQPTLYRNTKKQLLANKAKLDEYFNYIAENNINTDDARTFPPELLDIIREVLHMDIYGWVKRKNDWLANKNLVAVDDIELALNKLQDSQFEKVQHLNTRKAKARYASFRKALEVTTARIPGQDKQSYAGMKVVQFFQDEENVIYVPPTFQWTTGGDFDIDKVFTMYFSIGEDGLVSGWSELFDKRDSNFLEESLRLPVPDEGLVFKPNNITLVEKGSLDPAKLIDFQEYARGNKPRDYAGQLKQYRNVVDILRSVDEKGQLFVNKTEGYEALDLDKISEYVNWYNKESGKNVRDQKGATLNAIFSGVKDSSTDIRNMVDAYLGVTFGDYQAKASLSKKGEEMSNTSVENPVDVFRAQVANMIGKEVIGISASSGLKAYSVLANAMIGVLEGKDGIFMKGFEVPYLLNGKIQFKRGTGIHGINFIGNEVKYIKYLVTTFGISNKEASDIASVMKERGSLSLDLSAILSAATDNAKELILGRINAGPDTAGYYLAAAMLGIDVDTISTIMTSDTVESVLTLAKRDAFKGTQVTFDSALSQIKGNYLKARDDYFNFNKAINIATALMPYKDLVHEQYIKDRLDASKGDKKDLEKKLRDRLEKTPLYYSDAFGYIQYIPKVIDLNSKVARDAITELLANHSSKSVNPRSFTYNKAKMIVSEDAAMDILSDQQEVSGYEEEYDAGGYDNDLDMLAQLQAEAYEAMAYEEGGASVTREPLNSMNSKANRNILPFIFNRYLDDYDRMISGASADKNVLSALTTIGKVVSDLNVLAKITSVNQSIKNNFLDLKKFMDAMSTYEMNNYTNGKYTGSETSLIDVLGVIEKSPHMRSMVSAAKSAFNIYNKTSLKSAMLDETIMYNELPKDLTTFAKVSQAVEEVIIGKFLNDLPNMDSTFLILNGSSMTDTHEKTLYTQSVNVKTIEGRMNFIDWFENQVIPDLKKGKLVDFGNTGEVVKISNNNIKANEFLKRLTVDTAVDYALGGTYRYYRIPIDMLNTKTESEMEIVENLKFNYAKLQGVRYMGKDLTDLFFLYNLIVNKGKVNAVSFNPLINSVAGDYADNSLPSKYVRTIGEYDSVAYFDNKTLSFVKSVPFMKFLSSKGIGKLEEEIPALGNVVENAKKFVVVKKYNADEDIVETKTYYADTLALAYVNTNPSVSNKYLNVPDLTGVGNQKLMTEKVTDGIKRDKLNSLIANASRRIIDC